MIWNLKRLFYFNTITGEILTRKKLCSTFMYFEKTFDQVPRDLTW